ncbi:MAG: hypothetical protein MJ191_01885 [Clostridium sp.]|nr:hypothetical protein [Clostridium sp.]
MDSRFCTYKRVGYLKRRIANMIGIDFTGIIYASPGVLKHINKRHGKQFNTKSNDTIIMWMKDIIKNPDYIGVYTNKRGQTAVQIIKRMYRSILIGIQIDREKNIYVATMYPISEEKINSKLKSGKLIDIREDIQMVESYII